MLSHTTPDLESAWLEFCRLATPSQRLRLRLSAQLTNLTMNWSREVLKTANPEMTDEQIKLLWVEKFYGPELARRLAEWLDRHELSGQ